ncbi:MAG: DUF4435 domain-containing protein [Planctomycetes bacterium]|nr:DUF4435 domain-containing protein [Planctomycetota bacterium]
MIASGDIPQFPERALSSKAVLYRPLQDIDIYVEDEGAEVFYTELLKRLVGLDARIAAVIPLRGRQNVIRQAQEYSDSRPALFLVDGDLHWVAGLSLPSASCLYVHPCYCVENYLFCERAMIQISVENSGVLTEEAAEAQLDWSALREELRKLFVPLFVEFATAFSLCPEIKTVSRGIGCVLRNARSGSPPTIDANKVIGVQEEVRVAVLKQVDTTSYNRTRAAIEAQIETIADPLDAVSGKDFLVPVQMFAANRVGGQKVQRRSFVFRLARHCNMQKLDTLREKILEIIQPNKAMEATS